MIPVEAFLMSFPDCLLRKFPKAYLFLFLVILALTLTVRAQPASAKLEVAPAAAKVFANRKTPVLVVVRNPSSTPLTNLELTSYTDAILNVEGQGYKLDTLAAKSEYAWVIELSTKPSGEFAPGTVQFRLDYSNGPGKDSARGVALASLEVKNGVLESAAEIADVKVETTLESLTEQTPGKVYLVITNKINREVTATITPTWPYGLQRPKDEENKAYAVTLPPYQTDRVEIGVEAKERVRPGKHLLVFDVMLAWNESGQQQVRHNIIARPVDVGILGESQILTLIGIPSFLLLPGFLVLLTIKIVWSLKWFKVKGQPATFPWEVKSAEFSFTAITISFVLTGAYIFLVHNLFEGYGLRDIIFVWFFSVFIVGILGYALVANIYKWYWKRVTPSVDDEDPVPFLRKLGRRGLGIFLELAEFGINVDNQNVLQRAFLLESREDAGETIWVAPPINIQWTNNADGDYKTSVREQLQADANDAAALATLLSVGRGNGADQAARVVVSWKQLDTLNRPAEYKTSALTRLIGRTRIVNEDEDL
jgi:hypothetical protein